MSIRSSAVLAVLCLVTAACAPGEGGESSAPPAGVVEVTAKGLTFEMLDTIPSGWTTFRFDNESGYVHFAVIERLPEGVSVVEQQEEAAPLFQAGMDLLAAGEGDSAMAVFGELPAWFADIVFMGGPGLTAAGHTSSATVRLEPGTYLLECYVKTDGVFHSYNPEPGVNGMVHQFTVIDQNSGVAEPTASIRVELSSTGGMVVGGALTSGEHVVRVHFVDQAVYGNFVGHDVHLARLDDVDTDTLEAWMDWTQPRGLETPAPVTFLGGLNEMPAGSVGYFTANLEPGRYALVAELPGSEEKGMLRTFNIE